MNAGSQTTKLASTSLSLVLQSLTNPYLPLTSNWNPPCSPPPLIATPSKTLSGNLTAPNKTLERPTPTNPAASPPTPSTQSELKHQGNSLDDSEWSAAIKFTTGATRNLYTYYKERVELLESRIAGIEADEIVDDATDFTLLTAFANLVERVEALEGGILTRLAVDD